MAGRAARTILVVAPMASEQRAVARRLGLGRVDGTGSELRADRDDTTVLAIIGGVGPAAVAAATTAALDRTSADHVVVVGIAGGLAGQPIGSVLAPATVIDHGSGDRWTAADLGNLRPSGRLVTTDGFVDPATVAVGLGSSVEAVDMESAAVARVASDRGIPWTAIRSISDRHEDGLVDDRISRLLRPDGSPDLVAVVRHLAPAPWRAARLARIGRDAATAARAAAGALGTAIGW